MSANNVCVKEASWVQVYPTSVEVEVYMNFCFSRTKKISVIASLFILYGQC